MDPRRRGGELGVALVGDGADRTRVGDQEVGAGDADLGCEELRAQLAPGQTDASNNTTSATDISLTTDPSADTNLQATNQNNLITVPAGAWAVRNTLTLVNIVANNSGNIEIWGKASPSVAAWTKMTSYDAQLGTAHPAALVGGLDFWHFGPDGATWIAEPRLREAVVRIAEATWERYYAPVLGGTTTPLLGVYSHMISYPLYLADYPIGHLIAFQIEEHLHKAVQGGGQLGAEFERMASFGAVTPDVWMMHATGAPVGAEPLLRATEAALAVGP